MCKVTSVSPDQLVGRGLKLRVFGGLGRLLGRIARSIGRARIETQSAGRIAHWFDGIARSIGRARIET